MHFSKIRKRILSGCMAFAMLFNVVPLDLDVSIGASAAETDNVLPVDGEAVIGQAARALGTKYIWGQKGTTKPYNSDNWGTVKTTEAVASYGLDCSGFVHWALSADGLRTNSYVVTSPVPADVWHWNYKNGTTKLKKGDTVKWWVEDSKGNKSDITDVALNDVTRKVSKNSNGDYEYWKLSDGSELNPGAIVLASVNQNGTNGVGDHAWIYLGDFKSRDDVINYVSKVSGVSKDTVSRYTGKQIGSNTHWRMEASNGSTVRPDGTTIQSQVMIDNGTADKNNTQYYASTMDVRGNSTYSFRKVDSDTNRVILGYTSQDASYAGTADDGSQFIWAIYDDYNSAKNAKLVNGTPNNNPVDWLRVSSSDLASHGTWSRELSRSKSYYLRELSAPVGYEINDDVIPLVADDTVDIKETRVRGSMTIKKAFTGTDADKWCGKVTIRLTSEAYQSWDTSSEVSKVLTIPVKDGKGTISVDDLPVYGLDKTSGGDNFANKLVYKVTETSATPDAGYENCKLTLDTSEKKIILADCPKFKYETSATADFINSADGNSFVIHKRFADKDGNLLSYDQADELEFGTSDDSLDVKFALYKCGLSDAPDYSQMVSATKVSDGVYEFKGFVNGNSGAFFNNGGTKFEVVPSAEGSKTSRFRLSHLPNGRYVLVEESNSNKFSPINNLVIDYNNNYSNVITNNETSEDSVVYKEFNHTLDIEYSDAQLAELYAKTEMVCYASGTRKTGDFESPKHIIAEKVSDGVYRFVRFSNEREDSLTEPMGTIMIPCTDPSSDAFGTIRLKDIPRVSEDSKDSYVLTWEEGVPESEDGTHIVGIPTIYRGIVGVTTSVDAVPNSEGGYPSVNLVNALDYFRISAYKVSENAPNTLIAGAHIGLFANEDIIVCGQTLYKKDQRISVVGTNPISPSLFNVNLPVYNSDGSYAEYYVKELEAPDGYYLNPDKITVRGGSSSSVAVKDKEISYVVSKYNADKTELIAGAKMELRSQDGTVLESWITEAGKTHKLTSSKLAAGGRYYIHEVEAPAGYYTAEDVEITIPTTAPTSNDPVNISVVDRKIDAEVRKHGYDSINLKTIDTLEGAVLEVRDSENNLIDSWTSTASGGHKLPSAKLKAGQTYTLREVQAPAGYFKAADVKFTVPAKYTKSTVVEMTDNYIVAELSKTSELTGEGLAGATMHIYDKATGEEVDKWISDGGVHRTHEGLIQGHTYVFEEVAPPDGYVKSNEKIELVVPSNYKPLAASITNKPTQLNISKIDDGKYGVVSAVKGAKIAVIEVKADGTEGSTVDTWVTNGTTHVIKGKLKAGKTYIIREVEVPEGYVKADDIRITISSDGSVDNVDMVDSKMSVDIYKTNEDGEALKGATLKVINDTTGETVDTWTTDGSKHSILNVSAGNTYILHEEKPPKGYQVSPDVEFTFNADGEVALNNDSDETTWATVEVANEEEANKLTLVDKKTRWEFEKVDSNGNPIKDCEFELRDGDGNVLKTWVSDGRVFSIEGELEAGLEYTVHENKAKDGWNLAADIKFTVKGITSDEYGIVTITKMTDIPTHVKFSKQELTGQEELPGATLVVYDEQGNEIERWVSGATPHEVIAKYKAGATYTIHEETTPHGYAYAKDSTFTVSTDGRVDEVVVKDDFTKVSVLKVDKDTREPISGAHISLYKSEDLTSDNPEPVLTWITDGTAKRIDKICDVGVAYTLVETTAPNGYVVMEKYEFQLDNDYDGKVIEVVLEDDYTKAVIDKVDITTDDEDETSETSVPNSIIGATLRIEDMDGNLIEEWVTDGTPHHIDKTLVAGQSYKLIETFAPDGYVISEEIIFIVNTDGTVNHVVMKDDYTKVEVVKLGKDSTGAVSPLAGATLQLLDSDGNIVEEWVTNGAMHPFYRKLRAGATYTIHETKPPKGYSLAPDIEFTVNTDGSVNDIEMIDDTTKVGITKMGENKQNVKTPLAGAVLQVLEPAESADAEPTVVLEWTTDATGYKLLDGVLEQGKTYILHEVSAPKGYVEADDITFTVPVTGQLAEVEMVDKTTTVRVRKLDEDGNVLEGAELQLVDMHGNVVEEWQTDAEWYVIDGVLEEGIKYTLKEKKAPDGYIMSADIEVEVSLDGRIDEYTMVDKYTKVKFSKKSMTGEDELPGATMVVYDSEGNEIERWVSTTDPHYVIATYIAGETYRLHEEVAPTGYVLADDVEFTVSEDGSIDTVVMHDDTTKVSIDKTSIVDGSPVLGAVLRIVDTEGNLVTEWTTDGKEHRIDGLLTAGQTYVLVETYAPDGYVIADSVEFRVLRTGEILRVHMIDDVTKVRLYKRDMTDDSELSGARLQVIDSEGNVVDEWTSDGRVHELNGKLKAGAKYRLHEVSAPDGYLVSDDVEFTVNADGTVTTVVMKDAKKPVTETPKTPNTPNTGGDAPSVTNTDKIAVEEDGVKVEEPEAGIAKASASVSHIGLTSGTSTAVCGITFCGTFLVCLYLLRRRRKFQTK